MLASDFQLKLRKLNPKLRIFCGDDDSKAAGIFHVIRNEYTEICGIDKNQVPEFTVWDEQGHIIKSGWRRVINILISKKLINKDRAEKLFSCHWFYKNEPIPEFAKKYKEIDQYHPDDLRQIGSEL